VAGRAVLRSKFGDLGGVLEALLVSAAAGDSGSAPSELDKPALVSSIEVERNRVARSIDLRGIAGERPRAAAAAGSGITGAEPTDDSRVKERDADIDMGTSASARGGRAGFRPPSARVGRGGAELGGVESDDDELDESLGIEADCARGLAGATIRRWHSSRSLKACSYCDGRCDQNIPGAMRGSAKLPKHELSSTRSSFSESRTK